MRDAAGGAFSAGDGLQCLAVLDENRGTWRFGSEDEKLELWEARTADGCRRISSVS
jgi:hypothetical protein